MEPYANLAEKLVERKLLSDEEMERVVKLQQEQQTPLTRLIVELGFLSEDDLLPVLRDYFDIPLCSLKDEPLTPPPVELDSSVAEFLRSARIVPIKMDGHELVVATSNPFELSRLHALELAAGVRVKPVLAKEKEITARIEALFGAAASSDSPLASGAREIEGAVDEEDVAHLRDMASEVPVIRLVNQLLVRALESRASDVHIEPFENQLKVRYRIDGILHEVEPPPRQLKAAVVSRLKILAQLNIAERRLPQDGRIKIRLAGKDVDLRIATVPTLYGESVVIRLLERSHIFTELDTLGFPPTLLQQFNEMISKPHGMILVTGPTGSGKTTTLYGALEKINDPGKKIITIEDPVEYQLSGVNQIQVKPQIGLPSPTGCAPSCAKTRTSSWSARSATRKRRRSPCKRRSPAIWCFQRSIPTTPPARSRACWKWACRIICSPHRCWACWRKGWCAGSARSVVERFLSPARRTGKRTGAPRFGIRRTPHGRRSVATRAAAQVISVASAFLNYCRPPRIFAVSSCSEPMRARSAVWQCSKECICCARMVGTKCIGALPHSQRSFA
jgi:hypothetical protein